MTYRIRSQKVIAEPDFLSKKEILERQLNKCFFVVGDRVRFKKPKRNPVYGTIADIEENWDMVTWSHGGLTPNPITVVIEQSSKMEIKQLRVKTSVKRIILAANQVRN